MIIPFFLGFHTSHMVQDFFHEQYVVVSGSCNCSSSWRKWTQLDDPAAKIRPWRNWWRSYMAKQTADGGWINKIYMFLSLYIHIILIIIISFTFSCFCRTPTYTHWKVWVTACFGFVIRRSAFWWWPTSMSLWLEINAQKNISPSRSV